MSLVSSRRSSLAVLVFVAAGSVACTQVKAQTVHNLGVLQETHGFSQGLAVSADGNVVAGCSAVQFFQQTRGLRWTQGGGVTDIGVLEGTYNLFPQAINANGSAMAGAYYTENRDHAFVWTQASGIVDIGELPGATYGATAYGISADGSVVSGTSSVADGEHAFIWTQSGGMRDLGTLPGGTYSWNFGLSANGLVATGLASTETAEVAFVWSAATGMQALPSNAAGEPAAGFAISADGSVIAGYVGQGASMWRNGTLYELGFLPGGTFSTAYALSGDGKVVAGLADDANGDMRAFIWSAATGMVDLQLFLADKGVTTNGWDLQLVAGASHDGSTLTGGGTFGGGDRGWVVTGLSFGCPADLDDGTSSGTPDEAVTIDDLLYFLGVFEQGVVAADLDNGSGVGVRDNAVTIDDLLFFLSRFEAGC